jgi:hypothetical protein
VFEVETLAPIGIELQRNGGAPRGATGKGMGLKYDLDNSDLDAIPGEKL